MLLNELSISRSCGILCIFLAAIVISGSDPAPAEEREEPFFAVAEGPTPVLNVPDFSYVFGGRDGETLHRDASGLVREVEFVALPGTVFKVESVGSNGGTEIYRVTTEDYPYPAPGGYFIDSRFVKRAGDRPPDRIREMPTSAVIIGRLLSAEGSRYVWGGNVKEGVPRMRQLYPPSPGAGAETKDVWQLKGVDCSGLLYEATGGSTPRNTIV